MGNRVFQINKFRDTKAQGMLEAAIALIIIILFLGGIIKIWFWANNQIVQRQVRYNETRVAAGTSTDEYKLNDPNPTYGSPHPWPVYTPDSLTEEEVLLESSL